MPHRIDGVESLFRAILGGLVELAFGLAVVFAVPDLDRLTVPAITMVVDVIIATAAGVVAASFPARRASRLNVLDAISYE